MLMTLLRRGDKFQERGSACVFLGYPNGKKGYRLYDLKNHRIYSTHNVIFIDNIVPFRENYKNNVNANDKTFADAITSA